MAAQPSFCLPGPDISSCEDTNIWTVPYLDGSMSLNESLDTYLQHILRGLGSTWTLQTTHTHTKTSNKNPKETTGFQSNKIQLETGQRREQSRYFLCKRNCGKMFNIISPWGNTSWTHNEMSLQTTIRMFEIKVNLTNEPKLAHEMH